MANWRGAALRFCNVAGLPILEPFVRLAAGEDPKEQFKGVAKFLIVPAVAIAVFLGAWTAAARVVVTDSMKLPSPQSTWEAGRDLFVMHQEQKAQDRSRKQEKLKEAVTLMATAKAVEKKASTASDDEKAKLLSTALLYKKRAVTAANFTPSSAPTFVDQILTSLKTVFFGFAIATVLAVPIGVLCGMNPWFNAALNPMIQIFKPVSPLAWLPLAFLIIVWMYSGPSTEKPLFEKAFLISAATVSLCSLWPTLINTTLGVASVDKDYMNVAKVLKLSWTQQLFKIVLPASLPLMFAGMRISLGVGWMVLIPLTCSLKTLAWGSLFGMNSKTAAA